MNVRARLAAFSIVALSAAGATWSTPAHADPIADAEEFFRRAKALMNDGKASDACPLLAESYRLDPQMGTLLNLALCHEQIGRIAAAWGEFRGVEQKALAAQPPRMDRAQLAREHAEKLEPRLSRIKIVVPPEARVPGLVVKVDGEEKGEPSWAAGVTVDVGTRDVEVSAPDKLSADVKVKVDDEGSVQTVMLPVLADKPRQSGPDAAEIERAERASAHARRVNGYIIGGAGLATLAVGAVFGGAAIYNQGKANDQCKTPCFAGDGNATKSDDYFDRANAFANVANVLVPIGAVATAVGLYLVLTTPSAPSGGKTASVAVAGRPGRVDLTLSW